MATAASLRQETLDGDISHVLRWVQRSAETINPLNSPHEGYAYIRAAMDRLWSTALADGYRPVDRYRHCYDLSAAAVRYIVDLTTFRADRTEEERVDMTIEAIHAEVKKAMLKHAPMVSIHEAYGVIAEEVAELFEEVRPDRGRTPAAQKEALQVAAMGVRCVLDVLERGR